MTVAPRSTGTLPTREQNPRSAGEHFGCLLIATSPECALTIAEAEPGFASATRVPAPRIADRDSGSAAP